MAASSHSHDQLSSQTLVAPTGFFTGPTFAGNSGYRHFTGTVTGVTGVYRQFFTGHPQQV